MPSAAGTRSAGERTFATAWKTYASSSVKKKDWQQRKNKERSRRKPTQRDILPRSRGTDTSFTHRWINPQFKDRFNSAIATRPLDSHLPKRANRAAILCDGPVAQLDRASVFGTEGWGFKSLRGRQSFFAPKINHILRENARCAGGFLGITLI